MADNAEKKNIAKLDFKVNDALESLNEVEKKLKEISDKSDDYSKKISKNLNSGISTKIDTKQIQTQLNNIENLSKKAQEQMLKNAQKSQLKQTEIVTQETEKRKTAEYKHMLKQEEYNNRMLKSTENLYDKITQYAKTYVIYQGFNELKKGIQETIDEMVEVEQKMVAIDRVMNVTGMDINAFRDDLIQLAYDYGNAFDNVADVSLRLAQAGIKSSNNLALTEKTLLALNTAELDATQATDDMVAVMSQWDLITDDATQTAKEYGDIIDKVNKVADNFPTTSADILDALKKTSSAFKLAGADINETIATIVAAEKASQRGGKVIGTALSNITQQLKAEGKIDIAEALGISFFEDEAKTQFKPIMEIFQALSDKMAQLKAEGKESSTEMQELLNVFTVFRRNIGASLLGEMEGGEASTYMQVYKTALDSVGYSLQENEKYMKTAKAAQEQFNAELLKLKTTIWDGGLEKTFRDMLSFGKDLVTNLNGFIDTFGALPTTIGLAIGAFTAVNKKIQLFTYDTKTSSIQLNGFFKTISDGTKSIRTVNKAFTDFMNTDALMGEKLKNNATAFAINTKEMVKYGASLVYNTAKTIALQVATVALNAAISMGLSLAITAVVAVIDDWIHKTEKMVEANEKLMETSKSNADKLNQERENLEYLTNELDKTIKKYNELEETDGSKTETTTELYTLQTQINEALEGTGKRVEIINESLDAQGKTVISINKEWEKQIKLLDSISYSKKVDEVKELEKAMKAANDKLVGTNINFFEDVLGTKRGQMVNAGIDYGTQSQFQKDLNLAIKGDENTWADATGIFEIGKLDINTQVKYLQEWVETLEKAKVEGKEVGEALPYLRDKLSELEKQQQDVTSTTEKYNEAMQELYGDTYRLMGYQSVLQDILNTYGEDEGVKDLVNSLEKLNKQFANGQITSDEYFGALEEKLKNIKNTVKEEGKEISEGMEAIFAETAKYIAEGLETSLNSFEEGTSTFSEYQDALAKSTDSLLELYGVQNGLVEVVENGNNVWKDAQGNINDYATSLQNTADTVASFSDMLQGLGESYEYIKSNVDELGNANFQATETMSQDYQKLATNFGNSLANMRTVNRTAWNNIVSTMSDGSEYVANESEDVNEYVTQALATNADDLNAALNEANRQAQDATTKLGISTGQLLESLGEAISGFSYNIEGTPYITGDIGIKRNQDGEPIGLELPHFGFDITGKGGESIQGLGAKLKTFGSDVSNYISAKSGYRSLIQTINPYKSSNTNPFAGGNSTPTTTPTSSGGGGGGSSGGGSSSSSSRDTSVKEQEYDDYKDRLAMFKDFIDERERLEKRWVDKQKELGLLSNDDYLYIIQQRIERYEEYLKMVENATWMHEEDKLALEKEYNEKIEDLQVDYLGYLKKKLDKEISALKESNKEKINIIKNEATERINALKAVEKENDRIRAKEEYEKNRAKHLEDISYWEQRSGRQAQEALKEAKEKLNELDEEWQKQMEDWSIEDQIKAIEEERDAQVKAIEDAQEAEIKAMQDVYDAKVKLFAETGQIIYENSVIQSKALYNQYKNNFIDPLMNELEELNKKVSTPSATATTTQQAQSTPAPEASPTPEPERQYETYVIQWGDTLTSIARRFGTTIEDILDANPYVTDRNRIYAGRTLEIPKFHEGGIVGGLTEGFALLKPGEVVLKPEWASSLNRMMKHFDNITNSNTNNNFGGPQIEVNGNLVQIDANISNKTDADYLTKKVERMLKEKFNIKK